jgi:hypothetical protein
MNIRQAVPASARRSWCSTGTVVDPDVVALPVKVGDCLPDLGGGAGPDAGPVVEHPVHGGLAEPRLLSDLSDAGWMGTPSAGINKVSTRNSDRSERTSACLH